MASQSAQPNAGHTVGLCKCQLRVHLWLGSLAETSGEKLEPEDVFILNSVGPHRAKTFLSQLRYFSWQNKLKSKKVEATKNRAGERPCSRPPQSPPEHTWGRPGEAGGGGLRGAVPSCPQAQSRQLSAEPRVQPIDTGFGPRSYYSRQRALSG